MPSSASSTSSPPTGAEAEVSEAQDRHAFSLERNLDAFEGEEFDLVVLGGGINGVGVARDAARRGLRVALVEKEDFGYGTTGRSTRLIHGGLRYLQMMEFGLVRESLRERERLFRAAPHLVRPLAFLVPVYEGSNPGRFKLRVGLWLYDLLSFDKSVPSRRWLSPDEAVAFEPGIRREGLKGAAVFFDGQVGYVERLVLENALDAAGNGAVLANHVRVTRLTEDPETARVTGCEAEDVLTGRRLTIRGRVVVNATGPWLDGLAATRGGNGAVEHDPASAEEAHAPSIPRSRMTKGIHLITPRTTTHGVLLFNPEDGRVFFAIPWAGQELIGTTDTDFEGDPDEVRAEADDVEYLKRVARFVLPEAPMEEVAYTYAGIRNLVHVKGVSESDVSRRHLILDHEKLEGRAGLLSIVGGKITPYRAVCEETVDHALRKMGEKRAHSTRDARLPGAMDAESFDAYATARLDDRDAWAGLDASTAQSLLDLYGARHDGVLAYVRADPRLGARLCEHAPTIRAEVVHAVEGEMGATVADVVLRRTSLGLASCMGLHVAREVAADMAPLLGWDDARIAQEVLALEKEAGRRGLKGFPREQPPPSRPAA